MDIALLRDETDLDEVRALMAGLGGAASTVDFEEMMLVPSVRANTRLWRVGGGLAAFASLDEFNNVWFEFAPDLSNPQVEAAVVEWAAVCVRLRNQERGETSTLDAVCQAGSPRAALLERHGFQALSVRSLQYRRPLDGPILQAPLPPGFWLRHTTGEDEVEALVELHRSAFGTENMTVNQRLAMMRVSNYDPQLDLLAVAPDGRLAAFCVGGFEAPGSRTGHTDPVGTRSEFQRLGLGRAVLSAGLQALKDGGAAFAELGTSSENRAMRRLAESLGFELVSEKTWYSKVV